MPLVLVKLQLPFRIALPDDRAFQVLERGERTTIAVRGGRAERRTVFAAVPEGGDEAERVVSSGSPSRRCRSTQTEEVEDEIIDRDRVAIRFTSRGTNRREFLGNPPTGNSVEISEVAIFKLMDGKIAEHWVYPDMLSLQRQLSVKDRQ